MEGLSESLWRDAFDVGVVELGDDRFAVLNVQIGLRDDLRVWLRFHAVRVERGAVALAGNLEPRADGFTGATADGDSVIIRPLVPADAEWFTVFQPPGLERGQLEAVVRAYAATETVDEPGPWEEGDDPVEELTLVTTTAGQVVALQYDVECPYDLEADADDEASLHVQRRWGYWANGEIAPGGDQHWEVHPQMTRVVVEAVDDDLLVLPAAAMLAGWPAEATIIGMDPHSGTLRRRLEPEFESEIVRLLDHADRLAEGDSDLEFLRRTRDREGLAWTEEAFGAFTRLASAVAAAEENRAEWQSGGVREWSWPSWWESVGLDRPVLPTTIDTTLLVSSRAPVWATCDRFNGMTVYWPFEREFLRSIARNGLGPLFMAGYAGHGINSWGLGIVACFDAYIVVIQNAFGGAYMGGDDDDNTRHLVRTWNQFTRRAEELRGAAPDQAPSAPRWLVTYSDFRSYANVFVREPGYRQDDDQRDGPSRGWRPVLLAGDPLKVDPIRHNAPEQWPAERELAEDLVMSLVRQRRAGRSGQDATTTDQ